MAVDFVILMEFLPKSKRGKYMVMITMSGSLGVAYTSAVAWLLIPHHHWRLFIGACAVPMFVIFLVRLLVSVESPRFLLSKGKYDEAIKILTKIATQNKREAVMQAVQVTFTPDEKSRNFYDLFSKEFAMQTIQISTLWFLQATGYWGVTIFFPKYLAKFHIPPYLDMFVNICAQIPGCFMVIQMIDSHTFGRLWTLRIFIAGTMTSLLLTTYLQDQVSISVLAVVTYFFMPAIYSILQTYTPEVYPTLLRSTAMSWASVVISIPPMITAFVGAELISSHLTWLYPLIWGSVFFVQLLVAFSVRRETAARPIEGEGEPKLSIQSADMDI